MIYPLRDSDTQRIIQILASKSGKSINDVMRAAETDAGFVFSGGHGALCVASGVWYLRTNSPPQPESLDARYAVYIDGVLSYSKHRQFEAAWLVDKLCQLMLGAREIRFVDTHTTKELGRWVRLVATDSGWIDKRKGT